jgi:hypothetical protein
LESQVERKQSIKKQDDLNVNDWDWIEKCKPKAAPELRSMPIIEQAKQQPNFRLSMKMHSVKKESKYNLSKSCQRVRSKQDAIRKSEDSSSSESKLSRNFSFGDIKKPAS